MEEEEEEEEEDKPWRSVLLAEGHSYACVPAAKAWPLPTRHPSNRVTERGR